MIILDDSPSLDYDNPADAAADVLCRGVALVFALICITLVLISCFPGG